MDSANPFDTIIKNLEEQNGVEATGDGGETTGGDLKKFYIDQFERGGRALKDLKSVVTGEGRRELDLPELPDFLTSGGASKSIMALARDDAGKLDILRKAMKGQRIQADVDKFNNVYVKLPAGFSKKVGINPGLYYLNRPGLSGQDFEDIMTTGAIEALALLNPASRALTKIPGLGGVVSTGTLTGGASVAQDVAATAKGSGQGVDPLSALVATLAGGGGEAVSRAIVPMISKLFGSKDLRPNGYMSEEARRAIEDAGIDPADVTPERLGEFYRLGTRDIEPGVAARAADADMMSPQVPMTKGDLSRVVETQALEDSALRGGVSPDASRVMGDFRATQNEALKQNVERIGTGLGEVPADPLSDLAAPPGPGGRIPGRPMRVDSSDLTVDVAGDGMEAAQERLAKDATDLRQKARGADDAATSSGARLDSGSIRDWISWYEKTLKEQFGQQELGSTYGFLKEFSSSLRKKSEKHSVLLNRAEEFRQGLVKHRAGIERTPEGVNIKNAINEFDDFLDGVVENGFLIGDSEAVNQFKKARSIWARLKQKYEGDGIVDQLIEYNSELGRSVPSKTPEEALRTLFTASGVGFKTGATKAVKELRDVLGADSPEWAGLKQEAFARLLRSQTAGNVRRGGASNLDKVFSGDKFSTSFRDAMKNSPELMKTFFSPKELSEIRQFERVALMATNRVLGAQQTSNNITQLIRVMDNLGRVMPSIRVVVAPILKKFQSLADEADVRASVRPGPPPRRLRKLPEDLRGIPGTSSALAAELLKRGFAPEEYDERDRKRIRNLGLGK